MPNEVPEKPWMHIMVDFITKLLLAQGYDAILVVYNWLIKIAYFILTNRKDLGRRTHKIFQGLCVETT